MAKTKHHREKKRQLGQFLTPRHIAERIVSRHKLSASSRILEPGFGEGAFLLPLIEAFLALKNGDLKSVLTENVWGIELDEILYNRTLEIIRERFGPLPEAHNLVCGDFLTQSYPSGPFVEFARTERVGEDGFFDLVIGNPPFGGTVSVEHQDKLERRFGQRDGMKIKKESYSFFIVKSLDLVRVGGTIEFICSDTFLTIPTMKGLRYALMYEGASEVTRLDEFSPETSYPMVVLRFRRGPSAPAVVVDHEFIALTDIENTLNLSWRAGGVFAQYFGGRVLGDFIVASSGMTTGKNEYFVREIVDGELEEEYEFTFVEEPITLERELQRARLGQLSERLQQDIIARARNGETRRNVVVERRQTPVRIQLPHPDYRYYNKAQPGIVYAVPRYAIYWKDEGDAVLTYKRNGNWYLYGVGGAPFFGREAITWRLISSRLDARYIPEGFILDSGAPCAFPRDGIDRDELWFILGWLLTDTATAILKGVLNHTMNIQSKDIERMPYPSWVSASVKSRAVAHVRALVERAKGGEVIDRQHPDIRLLDEMYTLAEAPRRHLESKDLKRVS